MRISIGAIVTALTVGACDGAEPKAQTTAAPEPAVAATSQTSLVAAAPERGYRWHTAQPGESVQYGVPDTDDRLLRIDCGEGGRIINVTSTSVYMPISGLDLSSGARAGLTSFLAGVARTVADRNVTINNLLPGKIDPDRLRGPHEPGSVEDPAAGAARRARIAADVPARRLGTAEEFGRVCAFFCSVHAGYVTGRNIPIDGGVYPSAF